MMPPQCSYRRLLFALLTCLMAAASVRSAAAQPGLTPTLTIAGLLTVQDGSGVVSRTITVTTDRGEVRSVAIVTTDNAPAVFRISLFGDCSTLTFTLSEPDIVPPSNVAACPSAANVLEHHLTAETPTAIELVSFAATVQSGQAVAISWKTAAEIEHAGFFVYRQRVDSAETSRVNAQLIASRGVNGQGATYGLDDQDVPIGDWLYWLEDVDVHGLVTPHLPVRVSISAPTAVQMRPAAHHDASGIWAISIGLTGLLTISLPYVWRRSKILSC